MIERTVSMRHRTRSAFSVAILRERGIVAVER